MIPPPPRSTLFPYTTLFRSTTAPSATIVSVPRSVVRATSRMRSPQPRLPSHVYLKPAEGSMTRVVVADWPRQPARSEEHTSELQSLAYLVCRLLLEKKKQII